MRTQGTDENVVLTPVRKMAIAEQLSMLNTDEALEITPKSCRLRKLILTMKEKAIKSQDFLRLNLDFLLSIRKPLTVSSVIDSKLLPNPAI